MPTPIFCFKPIYDKIVRQRNGNDIDSLKIHRNKSLSLTLIC